RRSWRYRRRRPRGSARRPWRRSGPRTGGRPRCSSPNSTTSSTSSRRLSPTGGSPSRSQGVRIAFPGRPYRADEQPPQRRHHSRDRGGQEGWVPPVGGGGRGGGGPGEGRDADEGGGARRTGELLDRGQNRAAVRVQPVGQHAQRRGHQGRDQEAE